MAGIVAAVARHAARAPDKPFLILRRRGTVETLPYGALMAQARRFAAGFVARGAAKGATVALMLPTHAATAPAFLGAMLAGAVPSLFPPPTPKQQTELFWAAQRAVFSRVGPALIATDAATRATLAAHLPEWAERAVAIEALAADPGFAGEAAEDGLAFLQHSSGTTGLRKGVMLTHAAVLDFAAALGEALAIDERDVIASWLPLYHDMGLVGCLVLPMLLGLTVVQLDPFEWVGRPALLFEAIEAHAASLCWMPNFAFHHLLRTTPRAGRWALGSVRALIDCSEPCKPQTLRAFAARFAACGLREGALAASYGMAENVFIATQTRPGTAPRSLRADRAAFAETGRIVAPEAGAPEVEFLSCGPPIPRTEIRILDEAGVALRERAVGEIAVSSPYLFAGYHRAPVPEGRFAGGWYRTGDLGFLDDGEIFVCGRTDDLLIVNGRNVYAHDVEFAINARTAVRPGRCVAIAPESERTGSRVLVVIAESDAGDPAALAEAIRAVVEAEFGFPPGEVRIEAPGWMVKTTSGKVSRGANLAKHLGEDVPRAGAAREV